MARVVTLTANPLLNFVADRPMVAGGITRAGSLRAVAEGKGVNVARLLAAHGHEVLAVVLGGGPSGFWLESLLLRDGIPLRRVNTAADLRVGFAAPAPPGGKPSSLMADGFSVTAAEATAFVAAAAEAAVGAELLICSGSVPDHGLSQLWAAVASACAQQGICCWIDSYGPAMATVLAGSSLPALAKPNRQELATATGWDRLSELHCSNGRAGVEVRTPAGCWRVQPPAIEERNPIGSGDCYLAALAHARLSGWAIERQLAYAAAAGAANAAQDTVAEVSPQEISALADLAVVEPREASVTLWQEEGP